MSDAELTRFEKIAMAMTRFANDRTGPKYVQEYFLRTFGFFWIRHTVSRRFLAEGLDDLVTLKPPRGVLMVANHRSFFDQYSGILALYSARVPWARHMYFPVRSNFFYENPLGLALNFAAAGGCMYPPIFRQVERRELNDEAIDKTVEFLQQPDTVVGMHPEGTRGKGPDPYQFLPAQPGAGKIALLANPTVIPWFINGLSNDLGGEIRKNFDSRLRREEPLIAVMGKPMDLSDLITDKPRPTLYLKAAKRMMDAIGQLAEREKVLRQMCAAGEIANDDRRWISSWPKGLWAKRASV
jgi:1-acyl-sn-glycerol-3-phosphate acyltransferase